MIQAENLTKRFAGATVVDQISFSIDRGEIVGFLGPNGAGKTTTMRMLTAFIRPSGGRASIAGHDVETHPIEARRNIGYLPEGVPLYGEMRVSEFLRYRAKLKGVPRSRVGARVDEVIDRCGLEEARTRIIEQLSKGYRQRVGLAEALVHDPPILVLDEPTIGLDPNQIRQVRSMITSLGRERTIILSSHILPEVEQVCGRILIIDRGRIVAQDTPEALRRSLEGGGRLQLELRATTHDGSPLGEGGVREELAGLPGVSSVEIERSASSLRARLALDRGADLREEAFCLAVARGWTLLELSQKAMTLEEIFVNLTTRESGSRGDGVPPGGEA
jgi:ABC-2 type transport system ATP-binding protein